jgi:hypothetical protein
MRGAPAITSPRLTPEKDFQVKIRFGKHIGEDTESVMLDDPEYVRWALNQTPTTDAFVLLVHEFEGLVEHFDSIPIVARCRGEHCGHIATCCTLHRGSATPHFWCDACDPVARGIGRTKLVQVDCYLDACDYVVACCRGREADMVHLIRALAHAKGLPARAGKQAVMAFFAAAKTAES